MDTRIKVLITILLGMVWIGLALWQWDTYQEPMRVPLTNVTGVLPSGRIGNEKAGRLRVNLEVLAAARTQREATFATPRNIFAVPRSDGTLPVGDTTAPAASNPPTEEMLAQQAVAMELSQYRYLGFLRMSERKNKDLAVLSKNEEVVVVRIGDHLEDRLVLKAITPESVTIRDTGTRAEQTLPLSEDSPAQP